MGNFTFIHNVRVLESHNFLPLFVSMVRYLLMIVYSSATSTLFFLRAMYARWHEYARLAIFVTIFIFFQ